MSRERTREARHTGRNTALAAVAVVMVAAASCTVAIASPFKTPIETDSSGDLASAGESVVRIVTTSEIWLPDENATEFQGFGSGFVVDSSGLIVTNDHVIEGASEITVFVGDEAVSYDAEVVGSSPCNDLAVLDIDAEGLSTLDWAEGEIRPGEEIYAVGFPNGTEELTVLDGVVSKKHADGLSVWSDVEWSIEHTADTISGSSGGPIVTADGDVIGVEYMGNDLGEEFGIAAPVAAEVVEGIISGGDVDYIGTHGEAVLETPEAGFWVSSVDEGSPAELAGIEPGDLIVEMGGAPAVRTLDAHNFCQILREHGEGDPLEVEVLRTPTGETLSGTVFGDDPLTVIGTDDTVVDSTVADDATAVAATDG